jgi:GNAT superfamily N-acetyltransferase
MAATEARRTMTLASTMATPLTILFKRPAYSLWSGPLRVKVNLMIRSACLEDLEPLADLALRSKAVWGYSPAFTDACRDELAIRENDLPEVFVLVRGTAPIGFYSMQHLTPECVELGHLLVEPAEMRKGHGTTLLRDAVARARKSGYRVLVIKATRMRPSSTARWAAHRLARAKRAAYPAECSRYSNCPSSTRDLKSEAPIGRGARAMRGDF